MMSDPNLIPVPRSTTHPLSSMVSMQAPTLQNIRIRSVRDALQVFYGVATKLLPLITRRLDAEERRAIISGNVYVWEERGANTEPTGLGMERWTDGMGWGPSRVRDEFLFYHQKESGFSDDLSVNPVTPWAQMIRKREQSMSQIPGYLPMRAERLIKQTYSVHVTLPSEVARGIMRKWHLTAYFSQQRLNELDTVDNIRGIGNVPVPDGLFKSARAGKVRRDHRNSNRKALNNQPPHHNQVPSPSASHSPSLEAPPSFYSSSDHSRDSSPSSESQSSQQNLSVQSTLVPLEYLQNLSACRRNPVDEQFLRCFSSQSIGHMHRHSPV